MSPLNKTDEPCEARNRERRARWALRQERWQLQAEKGSVPPLRGEQEAIGTPKAEAEDSGPFRPVCRTSSAPRSLGRLKGNRDPEPKKKDEGRGELPVAFKTGCCCPHWQPGAGAEETKDSIGIAQVTCLNRPPSGLHFRRLGVTTGYRGTRAE